MLGGDHLSMILTLKANEFFRNSRARQCKRLLTPGTFLPRRSILIWWKRLVLKIVLRRVPHILASVLGQKRAELAGGLFLVLEQQQMVGFRYFVTSDESWFLQHYNHRQIWCLSADEIPARVARKISGPKTMLTVFLSIHNVVFIDWVLPEENSTTDTSVQTDSSRFPRSCATGAVQVPQDRWRILTMPYFIGWPSLKILSRAANSDMLSKLPITPISVPVTSFYSMT
jgi:hypothetical protein